MTNIKFQFEANEEGNMLFVNTDTVKAKAIVEVPEGASEDYGYINLKNALVEALGNIDMLFPYDGYEHKLSKDAYVEGLKVDVKSAVVTSFKSQKGLLMTASEIRALTGLSRVNFCKMYSIPYRTMENWEKGVRLAPEYVLRLLERCVRIDFETMF